MRRRKLHKAEWNTNQEIRRCNDENFETAYGNDDDAPSLEEGK